MTLETREFKHLKNREGLKKKEEDCICPCSIIPSLQVLLIKSGFEIKSTGSVLHGYFEAITKRPRQSNLPEKLKKTTR